MKLALNLVLLVCFSAVAVLANERTRVLAPGDIPSGPITTNGTDPQAHAHHHHHHKKTLSEEELVHKAVLRLIDVYNAKHDQRIEEDPTSVSVLTTLLTYYQNKRDAIPAQVRVIEHALILAEADAAPLEQEEADEDKEEGPHESGSHESGSHESASHESGSHESGSHESASHESGSASEGSAGSSASSGESSGAHHKGKHHKNKKGETGYVNHRLDKLIHNLKLLRTKQRGLAALPEKKVRQLEIGVRALLLNIERFNHEPVDALPSTGPVIRAISVPICHGTDKECGDHDYVEARAIHHHECREGEACNQKPQPQLVYPETVKELPQCEGCHHKRNSCKDECQEQNGCHVNKCEDEFTFCNSRCVSDVVRTDFVQSPPENHEKPSLKDETTKAVQPFF
jgi:hypothetical protein